MAQQYSIAQMAEPLHPEAAQTTGAGRADRSRTTAIRPFVDKDMGQVLTLYHQVFGEQAAFAFRARWRWAQQRNLCKEETYRWVLESGGRVVGFLATIPQPYWFGGATVVAHTPCDYMVHPAFRFHGISLMRTFFNTCPTCVSLDDVAATIQVTRWLGAKLVGRMIRYVKPLDGRAFASSPGWSRLPPVAREAAVRAWDLWSQLRSHVLEAQPPITSLNEFDERFDRFARRLSRQVSAMPARDRRFLKWRYGPSSPHAGRQIAVMTDGTGELAGYVIFYLSRLTDRPGYILDLQTLSPVRGLVGPLLLHHAIRHLREEGASKVCYPWYPSPCAVPEDALRRSGFIARGGLHLLVRVKDEQATLSNTWSGRWSLSYGDMEASHAVV